MKYVNPTVIKPENGQKKYENPDTNNNTISDIRVIQNEVQVGQYNN